jgi:hypothetical protein
VGIVIERHVRFRELTLLSRAATPTTSERIPADSKAILATSASKNQIERYMATPAQALAYKIGALKILELRDRAQQALGPQFSYAHFHDVIVGNGTLPLPIMESRVNTWIANQRDSRF